MPHPVVKNAPYVLVEPPGIVRATTLHGRPATFGAIRVGAEVEDALGLSWADLEAVVRSPARQVLTSGGWLGVEPLWGESDEIFAILLMPLEDARAGVSTIPPASSARVSTTMAAVAGQDPAAVAAVDLALRLGKTMLPIYLAAEDGSGADSVAHAIAKANARDDSPWTHVRVGALQEQDLQDWLFVSGPARARGGMFYVEDAHELDVETGKRLAKEVDRGVLADTHFVASGLPDMRERVANGTTAKELFLLLRSSMVTLPPLRDRDDLDHVVHVLLTRSSGATPGGKTAGSKLEITPEAMRLLRSHAWPGNLRELEAWLERAIVAAAPGRVLGVEHFPQGVTEPTASAALENMSHGLRRTAERAAMEEALRVAGGNVSLAAKKLGVARSTLYRMKQRHRFEP